MSQCLMALRLSGLQHPHHHAFYSAKGPVALTRTGPGFGRPDKASPPSGNGVMPDGASLIRPTTPASACVLFGKRPGGINAHRASIYGCVL
ncbi:hypothetical protein CYD30_25900 [Kosakonia cowanii]|nr:hypothetical protein CYD30_25900 [Kosakonia cowanii]